MSTGNHKTPHNVPTCDACQACNESARGAEKQPTVGAALVVGGGIGGMQASLDLAESGYRVYVVDEQTAIGGNMARLDKTFPTNDCAMCTLSPKLVEAGRHLDIELIMGATVEEVTGEPGNFRARVRKHPRFVVTEDCTGCGECADACPVTVTAAFEEHRGTRKAAYRLYPQATPSAYAIDKRGKPPCRQACPAECNGQAYTALLGEGKFTEALEVIMRRIPFPGICGRICHHPCEDSCNRGDIDDPVSLQLLKRSAVDFGWQGLEAEQADITESKSVGIVGGGPAGLTVALDLVREGVPVTVYDAGSVAGGTMRAAIPRYRLPEDIVAREVDRILELGVQFVPDTRVGVDVSFDELRQKHDAVVVAVGAAESRRLPLPGVDGPDVFWGVDFLRAARAQKLEELPGRVVVIGGGNVAIDTALTARRLGACEVIMACLEKPEEMPSHSWEIAQAVDEGVDIRTSWGPVEVLRDPSGKVTGITLKRCASVFDEQGRFSPTYDESERITLNCDHVVFSIGQTTDTSFLEGVDGVERRGPWVRADRATGALGAPGLFACGDVVLGPASVVQAIAQGHQTASAILAWLRGEPMPQDTGVAAPGEDEKLPIPENSIIRQIPRHNAAELPLDARQGFAEVNQGFTPEQAMEEAKRCLNCGVCSECLECVKACQKNALWHEDEGELLELDVGAVILTPGYTLFDAKKRGEYGYGRYANVITSMEFERMLSASGPTRGELQRPSDGAHPERIAFIQCVGSRELRPDGNPYCSSVCCMQTAKEAMIAQEHQPGLDTTVFFMDVRAYGKGFEAYYESARAHGVHYTRSMVSAIKEVPGTKRLRVSYITDDGQRQSQEFDMVILALGFEVRDSAQQLARRLNVELNEHGFCSTKQLAPSQTSRPGVFAAGAFTGPKDIPETVTEAGGAAALAAGLLREARGTLVTEKTYPPERDVRWQQPRVGVFVCNCGRNIGGVVDVPSVVEHAAGLPGVTLAHAFLYTCSQDAIQQIREFIDEYQLNRVVVASCTPRTHEPLFQDTLREAGLNPFLFEMTNIRDQCSWVHMHEPEKATQKARDLVAMAVGKARRLEPLERSYFDIDQRGMVIGGGVAGMTAALRLAEQGFEVYLVEKSPRLGGHALSLRETATGEQVQSFVEELVERVANEPLIRTYLYSEVDGVEGYLGNFRTRVKLLDRDRTIELKHGAIIVATGAQEMRTTEFLYDQHPGVITQTDLDESLRTDGLAGQSFAFIQCVGSRNDEHPYCSRVCCTRTLQQALQIKKRQPAAPVYVFFRELRSYAFREELYQQARRAGVLFTRYEDDAPPVVTADGDRLRVAFDEPGQTSKREVTVDRVVLAMGIEPGDNVPLAQQLKVPLTEDGFFLEAHMKLRPVDFAAEGLFLCGLAHAPKSIGESIAQANAAALRAGSLLSRKRVETRGRIATVNERWCVGCGVCVEACPYDARELTDEGIARVIDVLCQGCGACTVSCPSGASQLAGFTKDQLLAMVDELVGGGQ